MHDNNLKIIKILIVVLVLLSILVMISGIRFFKDSYYFSSRFWNWKWQCAKAELSWQKYNGSLTLWPFQENYLSTNPDQKIAKLIPILVYHGVISDPKWQPDEVNISTRDFQNQMFALKHDGWQTISMEDYIFFIQGKKQLPEKSFLLTFDDGRKDSFYGADPVIKAVGYKATMFVITGRSLGLDNEKSPFHLSQSELRVMVSSGRWEMGSHTQNGHGSGPINSSNDQGHYLINELWIPNENRLETQDEYTTRVTNDLKKAKKDIESKLGVKAISFAYPYGDWGQGSTNITNGQEILQNIVRSIYPISFIQTGNNDFTSNSVQNLTLSKRIGVDSSISADQLVLMLNNSRYKDLNYYDDFSTDQGWLRGWGDLIMHSGSMHISTNSLEDSASTFLSGSSLWKNYFVSAKISIIKGNSFEMVTRYNDENNYITCDFSGNQISLTQKIAGQDRLIKEAYLATEIKAGNIEDAGIRIDGNSASCYRGEIPVASGIIDDNSVQGGIGFKTWDAMGTGTEFSVSDLKVDEIYQ